MNKAVREIMESVSDHRFAQTINHRLAHANIDSTGLKRELRRQASDAVARSVLRSEDCWHSETDPDTGDVTIRVQCVVLRVDVLEHMLAEAYTAGRLEPRSVEVCA